MCTRSEEVHKAMRRCMCTRSDRASMRRSIWISVAHLREGGRRWEKVRQGGRRWEKVIERRGKSAVVSVAHLFEAITPSLAAKFMVAAHEKDLLMHRCTCIRSRYTRTGTHAHRYTCTGAHAQVHMHRCTCIGAHA